jgi:hypothetical protein
MTAEVWYEIRGSLVTRFEESVCKNYDGSQTVTKTSRTKSLNSFFEELQKQEPRIEFTPYLAEGRWIGKTVWGDRTCVLVELPPATRKIAARVESGSRLYELAMPYIVLAVSLVGDGVEAVQVFYRNSAIKNQEDKLYCPNLPNVWGANETPSCKMCTGWAVNVRLPLPEKVAGIVDAFLMSEFNTDLQGSHWEPSKKLTGHPLTFGEWEAMSKEDASFVLRIAWRWSGLTVGEVLNKGVGK